MKYYYGLVDLENYGYGFVPDGDNRITDDFIELTEDEHYQLLKGQEEGQAIVLYDRKVFNAPCNKYFIDDTGTWQMRTDEEIEAQEAQKDKEYISRLSMTKYDLYKYVLAPSGISYAQLLEVLESNPNLKVAWDLCAYVYRGDTDFIQGVKDFIPSMTDEILDNIFREYGTLR